MKKSPTTTIMLTLILLLILSGCQPKNPGAVEPTASATIQKTATRTPTKIPTSSPTNTPTPSWLVPLTELEEVELRFTHPWTGDIARTIAKLVDDFNQANEYSIFVKVLAPGSAQQVFQQSEAALRDGKGPNVVIAPTEELAYWHKMGSLFPLDGYLNDFQYGLNSDLMDDFIPLFWEQDVLDGQRLGIPISRNANFLVQNISWSKELGFDIPAMTPQLFRNQTCKARDELLNDTDWMNNGMGGWIVMQDEYTILSWLNAFQLVEFPNSETPYAFDQPATLDGFTFLREIFDEDCSWNARNPTHYEYFANRQALYISADVYDLEPLQKTFALLESVDQWQVTPYPQRQAKPELITHGDSIGILKSDPAQELASWLFIRWLSQPEQQIQLAQVNPGLPVSRSILDQIKSERSEQWNQVIDLLEDARPAPRTAEWRVARFVLQDAAYQIYLGNITPVQFPQIIGLLDTIIADISQQPASLAWE
ncbi:MAG: extracellular solute-binding protein [Anaerolineaceae bacterium]|nr:extracellular solute-binding protein [Anaerolineaceae bacterium]